MQNFVERLAALFRPVRLRTLYTNQKTWQVGRMRGERFAAIRLTIFGEADPRKAKPALEGRVLFGDEAPEILSLAGLNFPQNRHRVKSGNVVSANAGVCARFRPFRAGCSQPERRNHVF
jgi:hypothetical protein